MHVIRICRFFPSSTGDHCLLRNVISCGLIRMNVFVVITVVVIMLLGDL